MFKLLTVKEVARQLRVHEVTVRRYILQGRLQALKVGGRLRVRKEGLRRMISSVRAGPDKSKAERERLKELVEMIKEIRRRQPPLGMTTAHPVGRGVLIGKI